MSASPLNGLAPLVISTCKVPTLSTGATPLTTIAMMKTMTGIATTITTGTATTKTTTGGALVLAVTTSSRSPRRSMILPRVHKVLLAHSLTITPKWALSSTPTSRLLAGTTTATL